MINEQEQKMARMINGLIRYRDESNEAIDGTREQIDDEGNFDDELLEFIQELAQRNNVTCVLDSMSTPFAMTSEEQERLNKWLEENNENEWYWTCYFMHELRRLCNGRSADCFLSNLLNVAHDMILMEIKNPVKSGWIYKELVGYNLPHTGNVLNDVCTIICDDDSDVDCMLEACRILIVYYVGKDIDKFFIV